jgi:hypothetical protein
MDTRASGELPLGAIVEDTNPSLIPPPKAYTGEFVKLHPVEPEDDVDELFLNSHGSDGKERIWTYMAYGPFSKRDEMLDWLKGCKASTNMSFFTVI